MSERTSSAQRRATAENTHSPQGHEHGGHSMMRGMMLLCVVGMVGGVIAWGLWGASVVGAFCGLMMLAMIGMMVMPAMNKSHHNHRRGEDAR
jgi:predicted lipid-binding transport protein (Tim44 family)